MPKSHDYQAWLQHAPTAVPYRFTIEAGEDISETALSELHLGLERLCLPPSGDAPTLTLRLGLNPALPAHGYTADGDGQTVNLQGGDANGVLYAVFGYLRHLALGADPAHPKLSDTPRVLRRCLNHWDNINGSIERGYAGRSLFFDDGKFSYDPERLQDYARLLCSVGINEIAINNVNVTPEAARLCTEEKLPELAQLAAIFRPYGIRLVLTADFAAPVLIGGLPSADPLDPAVIQWWQDCAQRVWRHIPDLAGFLVKADSEFRTGPAALGRTQADGANVLARAAKPYGGIVYWRCFVYNCMQDWRDTATDRPKAAYDHFRPLDGQFDDNVLLQIKNGPSDFQVREPLSPLLGNMPHTTGALEFQITQEYTGQQIDLYALSVQWEEIFALPIRKSLRLQDIMGKDIQALTAVANVGSDENWTGHPLAQANLYAFGRLAWNPTLTAAQLTEEWARLSFPEPDAPHREITDMLLHSRRVYENYNTPLALGWMVNPNHHYGPNPEGYEFARWGTYHRADRHAIGIDRTPAGTGYTAQYDPEVAELFANPGSCPEDYLLYFHRLPYDYILKSSKTIIQHVYDTHFDGVTQVEGFIRIWNSLESRLPPQTFAAVAERFARQWENAKEWRDMLNTYFHRLSGVPDVHGRKIYD